MKAALARETMEEHRSPSSRGSITPPATTAPHPVPAAIGRMAIQTILVPTDFSPPARRAVTYARRFAEQFGARLILLHVTEPVAYAPPHCPIEDVIELQATRRKAAEQGLAGLLGELSASASGCGRPMRCRAIVVEGDVAEETNRAASTYAADLIVIATHGYTGLNRLLLGSTAEKLLRHAPCPVLVVREKERDFVSAETAPPSQCEKPSPQPSGKGTGSAAVLNRDVS